MRTHLVEIFTRDDSLDAKLITSIKSVKFVSFIEHLVSRLAKLNMAKSSLPTGDMDPDRAQKRITQTTSKSFFRKVRRMSYYILIYI